MLCCGGGRVQDAVETTYNLRSGRSGRCHERHDRGAGICEVKTEGMVF